jgi:16S rRNA U516 pseudouridylate synthase RsuA-like enzyme
MGTLKAKCEKTNSLIRVQSDADAENAEKYGSGAMILGRPCRVEKATAHCEFEFSSFLLLLCEAKNHHI